MVISNLLKDELSYRKTFYTDVVSTNDIEQDVHSGTCLVEDERIYIPDAFGYYQEGEPVLLADVTRYHRVIVDGEVTLMRDDAWEAFQSSNKLYDYGILIRVSTESGLLVDLRKAEHKSIKVLYSDKTRPWQDPFVAGPNDR